MTYCSHRRKHPLHVDYVFLGACLGYIQDALFEAILSHPRLSMERKIAIVKAIGKVIWIQNDLLAKWHTVDGQSYLDDGQASQQSSEEEGYLHGKKILGDENSIASRSSSRSSSGKSSIGRDLRHLDLGEDGITMACPFSGMRAGSPGAGLDTQRAAPPSRPSSRMTSPQASVSNGMPQLHVADGKVVGNQRIDRSLLG